MNSGTVLAGNEGCTTRTLDTGMTPATGAVSLRNETEFVVERRVDGGCRPGRKKCVAVGRRAHDHFSGCVGAGAGPVLDDDGLAEVLRQPLPDQARENVVRTAGGRRDDNTHWVRRKCLPSGDPRHRWDC